MIRNYFCQFYLSYRIQRILNEYYSLI